jgi:hypothetical protein
MKFGDIRAEATVGLSLEHIREAGAPDPEPKAKAGDVEDRAWGKLAEARWPWGYKC